jgi:putative ABC transport system permease protein
MVQLLQKLLFGVAARDVVTFAVVAGVLLLVGMLASFIPARRASKVDPMVALRYH